MQGSNLQEKSANLFPECLNSFLWKSWLHEDIYFFTTFLFILEKWITSKFESCASANALQLYFRSVHLAMLGYDPRQGYSNVAITSQVCIQMQMGFWQCQVAWLLSIWLLITTSKAQQVYTIETVLFGVLHNVQCMLVRNNDTCAWK